MSAIDLVSGGLLIVGAFFFFAGTVGLLRFPDVYTRLHALTKADNLGLGFVVAGLVLQVDSVAAAVELVVTWGFMLLSSSVAAQRIAWSARDAGVAPWEPE